MDQKTIEKMAIITTIVGIILLYIISQDITPTVLKETIPDTTKTMTITGTITKITTVDKAIFIEVEGQTIETTKAIVFTSEPIGIKTGDHVEIQGATQIHNGKVEIIANEIKLK